MSALLQKLPVPQALVERLEPLLSLLPATVPKPLKWAFFALLLVNWDGFPGVWHLRIIWPFIKFQWQVKLGKKWPNWRVGKDEFAFTTSRQFRASPNSCDSFGMHLSNSEYSICLDHVRGPFAVQLVGDAYGVHRRHDLRRWRYLVRLQEGDPHLRQVRDREPARRLRPQVALHPDDVPLPPPPAHGRPNDLRPRALALRHQAQPAHDPAVPGVCAHGVRRGARRSELGGRQGHEPGGEAQVAGGRRGRGQGQEDRVWPGRARDGGQERVARPGAARLGRRRRARVECPERDGREIAAYSCISSRN